MASLRGLSRGCATVLLPITRFSLPGLGPTPPGQARSRAVSLDGAAMFAYLEIADWLILTLMFLLFTGGSAYAMLRPRDRARLFRVERKLDLVLKHLNIDASQVEQLSEEARKFADQGEKIAAIKVDREQTALGLREAKEDVEAYMAAKPKP